MSMSWFVKKEISPAEHKEKMLVSALHRVVQQAAHEVELTEDERRVLIHSRQRYRDYAYSWGIGATAVLHSLLALRGKPVKLAHAVGLAATGAAATILGAETDYPRYFRDISQLPLKAGSSEWCTRVCPALRPVPMDHPNTPELLYMSHLVANCRQREDFRLKSQDAVPWNHLGIEVDME